MILCANPFLQYKAHQDEIDAAVLKVMASGHYIKGPELTAFENEFAQYIGSSFGIGVANGTDALKVALKCLGIGPGDEVITVSHTAVATVAAIELSGAVPVLVDIEPSTFTLNLDQIEEVLTPKTKAVIAVHLYGQSTDMDRLQEICKKNSLFLIEDCAQSTGAKWKGKRLGSFGVMSCFSFYPTKNLGALGDGGIVLTSDLSLAEKARQLREYGWIERFISEVPGLNSRLDELQAAILRVKLRHLDSDNQKRQALARFYTENLKGLAIETPLVREGVDAVFHLYVTRTKNRDAVLKMLADHGIQAAIHYPRPVHKQPAYLGRVRTAKSMAETERAAREILSLPLYPELSFHEAEQICSSLKGALN